MISNKAIHDKLKEKTKDVPEIFEFLKDALENESEGKQYKKPFTIWIKRGVKSEEEGDSK